MNDFIPRIINSTDIDILRQYYSDVDILSINLFDIDRLWNTDMKDQLGKYDIWIDPGIEVYRGMDPEKYGQDPKFRFYKAYDNMGKLTETTMLKKPEKSFIDEFVPRILDDCRNYNPKYISVPQFPILVDKSSNRLNKALKKATAAWYTIERPNCQLILPVVISKQILLKQKASRGMIISQIVDAIQSMNLYAVWIVDAEINDEKGSNRIGDVKFPNLIKLHQELTDCLALIDTPVKVIGGPYWGVGIVLWARNLLDLVCIGMGRGYRYFPNSLFSPMSGIIRIMLPSLFRNVDTSSELSIWLKKAI